MRFSRLFGPALMIAVTVFGDISVAQNPSSTPPAVTIITIPDMQCPSCAKKISTKVSQVPGVAQVKANVEATTLAVHSQPQKTPSPKTLWEAVEKAGYRPSRLDGPSGTFTTKPKA